MHISGNSNGISVQFTVRINGDGQRAIYYAVDGLPGRQQNLLRTWVECKMINTATYSGQCNGGNQWQRLALFGGLSMATFQTKSKQHYSNEIYFYDSIF